MASAAHVENAVSPASSWQGPTRLVAVTLQAGWLVMLVGVLAVAFMATPALHARFQTPCPQAICEILPQPNVATISLLLRAGITLPTYAGIMVGVEWLCLLVWSVLGAVILWHRPRDLVALLLAYGGIVGASKSFLDALGDTYPDLTLPARIGLLVTAITVPIIIALFPDGVWVPHWTRWVAPAAIGYGAIVVVAGDPVPELLGLLEVPLGIVPLLILGGAQIYRYRRKSTVVQRQQTKWVLFGFGLFVANVSIGSLVLSLTDAAPYQLLFVALCYGVFLLLGVSVTFAILRYRLFAIDVIINKTLVYGGLTAAIVGLYALIVGGLGALLQAQREPAVALLATGIVAVAFAPLRDRLQRGANRLLYGDRDDPYAILSRLARQLEGAVAPGEILPAIVLTMTEALRLPYAAIILEGDRLPTAAVGHTVPEVVRIPLVYQNAPVGELEVAPRGPGDPFSPADQRLLNDLARQIGVAVHAVRLTADLQRSRERIVSAREEERRRLRRDLHDGLGAQLAALAIQAGVLRTAITRDPEAAQEQASELRAELKSAVADIRRLVHGLRPPALDELGLVGALHQRAARYGAGGIYETTIGESPGELSLTVSVIAPEVLPVLPAAVEVAVFRIVDEALANVAKHARARTCVIRLDSIEASRLTVQVEDDGSGIALEPVSGVGLLSMRERAEELGGSFTIEPRPVGSGTRLVVQLPLSPLEQD